MSQQSAASYEQSAGHTPSKTLGRQAALKVHGPSQQKYSTRHQIKTTFIIITPGDIISPLYIDIQLAYKYTGRVIHR